MIRLLAGVTIALLSTSAVGAQSMEVPVGVQVNLFLKVMAFDRNANVRPGGEITVGVVYQSGFRTSADVREAVSRAVRAIPKSPRDSGVRLVAIDLDRTDLGKSLRDNPVMMLYVAPLRSADIRALSKTARDAKTSTFTGVPGYVPLGLSVSVRLQGDRPRLLINLPASRLEGASYSAELLKLAQVVQ